MKSKTLFTVTALIEVLTGIGLILAPALLVRILLGSEISTETEFTICRVGGSAIIALGITCWLARNDNKSGAAKALTFGMLIYNTMVFATLAYSGMVSKTTIALVAALIVHLVLGVACLLSLKSFKRIS
jgi:hypothetical protein